MGNRFANPRTALGIRTDCHHHPRQAMRSPSSLLRADRRFLRAEGKKSAGALLWSDEESVLNKGRVQPDFVTFPPLRKDPQGDALGFPVSAPSGRQKSATSKFVTAGNRRSRAERATCSRPTFHRVLRPGPEPNGLSRHPCKSQDNRRGSDARTSPPL